MEIHELKILPEYFEEVKKGNKLFELRKDDRNIQAGDRITLREYENGEYTGRVINNILVRYTLRECSEYGLKEDYCILGLDYRSILECEI